MKIFKFIRTLFSDFYKWLKYNEFFEALYGLVFVFGSISIIMLILGFIVDLLGIHCGDADHVMEKGAMALVGVFCVFVVGGGIWSFYQVLKNTFVSLLSYLKKTWKEI